SGEGDRSAGAVPGNCTAGSSAHGKVRQGYGGKIKRFAEVCGNAAVRGKAAGTACRCGGSNGRGCSVRRSCRSCHGDRGVILAYRRTDRGGEGVLVASRQLAGFRGGAGRRQGGCC